ncbi:MAG: DNA internalization-related competence protein ComEC/Rec2 [Firmicutes bacterium]|nr:DNA internalization-related competence protein ComEC/Rec2 [Bacillota bacterium]
MRRKNLILTAVFVIILMLLHGLGFSLKQSAFSELEKRENQSSLTLTGKVMKIKQTESGGFRMEVRVMEADGNRIRPGENILLVYDGKLDRPWSLYRRAISFESALEIPQGRRNPGCFDYALYLKSQGIFFQCSADKLEIAEEFANIYDRISARLIEKRYGFTDRLNPASKGLISGVLFGDTSALSEDIYEDFRNNGTAHVLAVSGLHVGILYSIYRKIFGNSRSPAAAFCLLILLTAYGTISMWTTSVIRAGLMICLHTAAQLLDLRYDMATGLSTVALLLILVNPYVIFSTGFQMSFLAVSSICFITPVLSAKFPDGIATALAVNLGLLFYQMYQFNYISLVSILANIPVIYLTGILVPAALAVFFLFAAVSYVPEILHIVLDSLCFFTVKLNEFSTLGGYGSCDAVSPPLWLVFSAYFLLFFLLSEQNLVFCHRRRIGVIGAALVLGIAGSLFMSDLFASPVSNADIVFVDVGQGDCIHIKDGSRDVMIDGGGSWSYNIGKDTLKPYLLKNGAGNVDMAIATHLHMDHYKGLEELSEVYPVKQTRTGLTAGDVIPISERVWIETLWPLEIDPAEGQESNEACSVFMIHFEDWKIMITGDLDEAGELKMVEYYERKGLENRMQAHILKVGHHGSATSTSDIFLDAVNPQFAVFQVGEHNNYGHPSDITVEKIQKRGIIIRRNDYNGAIGFSFRNGRIQTCSVIES